MFDKEFVNRKIRYIKRYIDHLRPVATEMTLEEVKKDYFKYYAAERLFQLIVDEIIDINNYFIKEKNLEPPDDFQSTFKILADSNILPSDFAKKIAPVVGLRNRLVHRYEEIDRDQFLAELKRNFYDFEQYISFVQKV